MANRKFEFDTDGFEYYNDNYVKHPSKSATTGTSGVHPYNGMGRVVLKKNMVSNVNTLTQAMINTANTIYVIKYDYVLGANITVPTNCVLEFDGGSIIGAANRTLTMSNCYLKGLPKFNNVVFAGNIKNDMFDCTWIENGNDIGAKINYSQTYFKRLYIPYGEYDVSTPILITSPTKIQFNCSFNYVGTATNDKAAIEIEYALYANIFIYKLTHPSHVLDYKDTRTINFIGICFTECRENNIFVGNVTYFNENIRLQSIYGNGCVYNKIRGIELDLSNIGIRIYQRNDNQGNGSWATENYIQFNNISKSGDSSVNQGTRYAIFIGGCLHDNPSFANPNYTDSYDKTSGIFINGVCMENFTYPIYAVNVTGLSITNCREENTTGLLKAIGVFQNFNYVPSYQDKLNNSDFSHCKRLDLPNIHSIHVPGLASDGIPYKQILSYGNSIDVDSIAAWSTNKQNGIIIDTREVKLFNIVGDDTSLSDNWYICKYLKDDGVTIVDNQGSYPAPGLGIFDSTVNGWTYLNFFIKVPDNVNYIFVGIKDANVTKGFTMYSNKLFSYKVREAITSGTAAERPNVQKIGIPFFNKDTGIPNFYNGTKWVNATGNPV